jgi:hypothetical protein
MKEFRTGRVVIAAALVSPILAHAALGGGVSSVQMDQARMMASRGVSSRGNYTVQQMVLDTGTVVREYMSVAGTVFAVSWQGPLMPDVQALLGNYAQTAADGTAALRAAHGGTGPVGVASSALVVQSGGHMGAYTGRAYVPGAVQSGVNLKDIK